MVNELLTKSAKQLTKMINAKEVSSREIVAAHIEQINTLNPVLNAVVQFKPDAAMQQAKAADKALARGDNKGHLHGLPITIKDAFYVDDFDCCLGSTGLVGQEAQKEATVISRLRDAGAIVLGITNVPELLSAFECDNLVYGRCNNPYDIKRTPSGSSGGEAAIIAACGSPLGVGSDAGGSVRVPAHFCGIAGIKPTQYSTPISGAVPSNSALGLIRQIVSYGPMARYVEDLVLALSIMVGPDGIDPHVPPVSLNAAEKVDISKLRVVYHTDNGIAAADEDTTNVIKKAVSCLSGETTSITEHSPEILKRTFELMWEPYMLGGDKGQWIQNIYDALEMKHISPLHRQFFESAKPCELSVTELRQRFIDGEEFRFEMFKFMQDYDVMLCPVAATPAKKHGETFQHIKDFMYAPSYNLLGWPAVVVRCGTSKNGLPIGVQIVAKPWQDHIALAIAQLLENKLGGWQPPAMIE